MASFDWSTIFGPGSTTSSDAAYFSSLLGDAAVSQAPIQVLPSLTNSETSTSPDSTGGSSEQSPVSNIFDPPLGFKRKSDDAPTFAQKDRRAASDGMPHTHNGDYDDSSFSPRHPLKTSISERRRDQNRAAQRAFRERKEKHVKDLEERVATLASGQRERDLENENLRDLVNQLRKENERLGSGQNRFTQSTFVPDPKPTPSKAASLPPAPITTFPSILGGMGQSFLMELSGQGVRNSPMTLSPATTQTTAQPSLQTSQSPATAASNTSAYDLFTPGGQHFNLGTASTAVNNEPDNSIMGADFSSYFTGLAGPSPAASTSSSSKSTRPPDLVRSGSSDGQQSNADDDEVVIPSLCPFIGQSADIDIDVLCSEMKAKATCQEYARQALEAALQEDVKTMARLEGKGDLETVRLSTF